jgi:cyclophilin family peptidyl-prolyl cis-trans isomerase
MNTHFSRLPARFVLAAALLTASVGRLQVAHAQEQVNPAVKTYKAVDPQPGLPAEVIEALKKLALPTPPLDTPLPDNPKVVFHTSKGDITFALDAKAAPLHVRSFLYLVNKGFYDGITFHRYADLTGDGGYIIQGGDPLTKTEATRDFAGVGGPGYQVPLELSDLKHDKFALAAARSRNPDSAGSQFYICQAPVHFLDGNYTVFGKVVDGENAALQLRQGDVIKSATVAK